MNNNIIIIQLYVIDFGLAIKFYQKYYLCKFIDFIFFKFAKSKSLHKFDGVVVGAVCEKLQIDPLKQNVKCDFEQECVDLIKLIGSEFDAVKLRDLQANIKQLFVDFIKNSNIPHNSQSSVLCAGDHSASQLKDTLIDCNLLPHRAAHEDGARWPTTPVVFHCNLWRFLSQDDQFLDNLGVFPDPNSKQIFTSEVPMITSDTITKELDLDFIFWVERRLAYYGVNGTALGRVSRLCIVDGKLHNVQKADLVPMLCYADFSDKKFAFDSIIIAAKSRPLPAVKAFIPIANSGAPVSVFAETLPALEEVGNFVVTQRNGIRFGALKCHAVQQQILPNRTHPVMIGPLSTGYVANFFTQLSTEDEGFVKAKYSKDNEQEQINQYKYTKFDSNQILMIYTNFIQYNNNSAIFLQK
ncbi:hypothetical protein SS50377_23307 [Spironucleus salmonicida]|uniref:tRNA (adenine(58)-N(1))-methyltransferase non-catalytic subunit TRM6 n=1 Tax=Spironucleus salmonicida TaxID=348837 RepID=V6LU22_9EUKA|nr:hypothetical protein SS50377_23307 [Spironucleus salmonicida]|eukprot:EST47176.1 Hypothetical protein SS50377_12687 [Spironucleus salmonicida]